MTKKEIVLNIPSVSDLYDTSFGRTFSLLESLMSIFQLVLYFTLILPPFQIVNCVPVLEHLADESHHLGRNRLEYTGEGLKLEGFWTKLSKKINIYY